MTVDELAQLIRRVDGNHSLGAVALAEALHPAIPGLEAMADLEAALDKEWVYSAELKQQLAAALEELAYTEAVAAVMEAAIHKIAARRILATGDTSIPDLSAEEANRAAFDVYNAIATLQRDRQP